MKSNLILKQYQTEPVEGTQQLQEITTFFGSKMMEIEDTITIDNKVIQYSQYLNPSVDDNTNGFQYYEEMNPNETIFLTDLINVKKNNHTIKLQQQKDIEKQYNTRWEINISIKNILREYLFSRIKEARTFKCLKYSDFLNKDINASIYQYIDTNVLSRYKYDNVDFFVVYKHIPSNNRLYGDAILVYDPIFDSNIDITTNKVTNLNVVTDVYKNINNLTDLTINYYQIKPSTEWKFDYYFNLIYKKI